MPLRQADVLAAAVALLDEVGLDELSTRKLADRLGVRPGALYWHYASKQALLDAIAEQVLTRMAADLPDTGDWAERLRAFGHGLRRAMLARRDGARLISTMNDVSPLMMDGFTQMVDMLCAAGASFEGAVAGVDAVTSFVNGYTLEEQARKVGRVPREFLDLGFATGLDIVVAGLQARVMPPGA
ncbi:TetR/AcrR family transcriptional regulator C-terminal domain-containing protein [Actinocrispum wychmicini]|uniref:TetR family transcriptional regulator n=1 Tax=Actinocrispum wychmicini TaxID=1213861 RepID=A0A4V2S7Q5_9PSEU|nr:TetR/AcrR family transcriptional regulator C-terminal domain-containing protein [Actinocrispum wychmicini]TCO60910.1 TetR family transcriptional regulator [Actinocrispum wychmicini]